MTKRTYLAGDRVYVPTLAKHVVLLERVDGNTDVWQTIEEEPPSRIYQVHITAMEPEKSGLYREPDTSGW